MNAGTRVRSVLLAVLVAGSLAACTDDGLDPDTPTDGNVDQDVPPATDTRVADTLPAGSTPAGSTAP